MIIFVGIAGSGKSVQGKRLAQALNCQYISMGECLRDHVDPVIQKKMLTGELISDTEVIDTLSDVLPKIGGNHSEFILDGFPRTLYQAEWLVEAAKREHFEITIVFHMVTVPEIIIKRLLERHRPDDHMKAINKRLEEYRDNILPIIDYLKQCKVSVRDIDASGSIEDVNKDIIATLKSKK